MQHRAEDLALDRRDAADGDDRGRHEAAAAGHRQRLQHRGPALGEVAVDAVLGLGVDHRADVGRGLPGVADDERVHRAGEHLEHAGARLLLHVEHRSAEQRWPADWKAEASTSRTTCSVSAVESTIIALMPPVSAMSTASGAAVSASVRLIACATSVEPVKTTPAMPGAAVSGAPTVGPSPGRSCSAAAGTPGRVQELDGAGGDQRRLLGGLGDHRVAGAEGGGDLAGEDREREVPGRDADQHAARPRPVALGLRRRSSAGSRPPRAARRRRRAASCRPRAGERGQLGGVRLVEVGGARAAPRALGRRPGRPAAKPSGAAASAAATASGVASATVADGVGRVSRIGRPTAPAPRRAATPVVPVPGRRAPRSAPRPRPAR